MLPKLLETIQCLSTDLKNIKLLAEAAIELDQFDLGELCKA